MKYIEIFLEALAAEKGRGKNTLAAYSSDLHHAQDSIGDLLTASNQDIQNYLSHLTDKPSSIARKASSLRTFYKFLMLEKIITKNPTNNLELPKRGRALPKYLSPEEIDSLMETLTALKSIKVASKKNELKLEKDVA